MQMYRLVVHTFGRSVRKMCLWRPRTLVFSSPVRACAVMCHREHSFLIGRLSLDHCVQQHVRSPQTRADSFSTFAIPAGTSLHCGHSLKHAACACSRLRQCVTGRLP